MARRTNVSEYLAEIGRRGGEATSRRKAAASRKNGKLGGWPKGKPRGKKKRAPAAGTRRKKTPATT